MSNATAIPVASPDKFNTAVNFIADNIAPGSLEESNKHAYLPQNAGYRKD
jgi:hypothetical protein